MPVLP